MCGIAGLWDSRQDAETTRAALGRMVTALRHRGPDDQGLHVTDGVGIGMSRLSIMDVAGGHQPLSSEDGRVTVVCNGEIYNHDVLRRELIEKGHVFKSRSDVEVIVHLYEEVGLRFVDRLRGMFAIALWDDRVKKLVIARDRLGIKPLYYARTATGLLFGSEIKALARSGLLNLHLDVDALDQYLTSGYIPSPLSIYKEIRKLDPGHLLVCQDGRTDIQQYWRLRFDATAKGDDVELTGRFLELFRDSVRTHLMSDVALGAFLSGGVDSSLIVALMSEFTPEPIKTYTIGFGGQKGGVLEERPYARMVSQRYGTAHTEFETQPALDDLIDEFVDIFDEPFADDSMLPTYHICKLAREHVTVALTGLGGDELFGGYERHLGMQLSGMYTKLPRAVRKMILPIVTGIPERKDGHYTVNHLKRFVRSADLAPGRRYLDYTAVFNEPLKDSLYTPGAFNGHEWGDGSGDTRFFDAPAGQDLLTQALSHDTHTYLPDDVLALTDRVSMRHSLELRVPFLDHPLVEFCATLPSRHKIRGVTKKYMLQRAAGPFLPSEILTHRKQGFASPMAAWLRGPLKGYIASSLSKEKLAAHGLFRPAAVESLLDEHMTRTESREKQLFTLLMFQKWHERYM
jgi:asparagine synthase (glutamine-hydrolysing)